MTQEQKDLLIKDLCSRLPYNVMVDYESCVYILNEIDPACKDIDYITVRIQDVERLMCAKNVMIENIKPYLFPLSSMTEEQWNNAPRVNLTEFTFESLKCGCFTLASYTCDNDLHDLVEFINWLIENNFDINGLIPNKLAIDATNLNIY